MSSKFVCVVGCGTIGRHHVASTVDKGFRVHAVDPMIENITLAGGAKAKSLGEISLDGCDAIVVSTTSAHRFNVVSDIEDRGKGISVILEKPLFCTKEEYNDFSEFISTSANKYYINLPNYWMESWSDVASLLPSSGLSKVVIDGAGWGMACNILHDISILMKLFGIKTSEDIEFLSFLGDEACESKRPGFWEIFGVVKLRICGVDVEIKCRNGDGQINKNLHIFGGSDESLLSIDLHSGNVTHASPSEFGSLDSARSFSPPRASESTGEVIEELLGEEGNILPEVSSVIDINQRLYESFSGYLSEDAKLKYYYPFS